MLDNWEIRSHATIPLSSWAMKLEAPLHYGIWVDNFPGELKESLSVKLGLVDRELTSYLITSPLVLSIWLYKPILTMS